MKFKVTVRNGGITQINNSNNLFDLAHQMAEHVLNGKQFPDYKTYASKVFHEIVGKFWVHDLFTSCEESYGTPENIANVIEYFNKVFVEFKNNYKIPTLVPDGEYCIETITVVTGRKRRS